MVVIAALEAVALVAVVVLFLRHIQAIQTQAAAERSELANRIQHPERVPTPQVVWTPLEADEPDEEALVGTVAEPKSDD